MVPACRQAGSAARSSCSLEKQMYFVYIIKSLSTKKFYTGITSNVDRRLKEHNKSDTKTTRSGKPWILVHSESFATRLEARQRELFLKSGSGREYRNSILPR